MTIPPPAPDAERARRHFAALRELRDRLAAATGLALSELSMGMTDDFEVAIEEGATIVRVGRAIFGERGTMKKLGFIGGGNMAEALARGLVENKVFKAARADRLRRRRGAPAQIQTRAQDRNHRPTIARS